MMITADQHVANEFITPMTPRPSKQRFVLDNFETIGGEKTMLANWAGFTDTVMGGRSRAEFSDTKIMGKRCLRLAGHVTCQGGGGFAQIAAKPAGAQKFFDVSAFSGIEVLTLGNNQHYNIHIRTIDAGWYDQSYRTTFFAPARWQKHCFTWSDFEANGIDVPMDIGHIQRIGFLGWMRDFKMDLAIGEVAFFA